MRHCLTERRLAAWNSCTARLARYKIPEVQAVFMAGVQADSAEDLFPAGEADVLVYSDRFRFSNGIFHGRLGGDRNQKDGD